MINPNPPQLQKINIPKQQEKQMSEDSETELESQTEEIPMNEETLNANKPNPTIPGVNGIPLNGKIATQKLPEGVNMPAKRGRKSKSELALMAANANQTGIVKFEEKM